MSVQIVTIMRVVAAEFDVTMPELRSPGRARHLVHARQVAMFLSRRLTAHSYPQIGRAFQRDHTTVWHAERVVAARVAADYSLATRVAALALAMSAAPRRAGD